MYMLCVFMKIQLHVKSSLAIIGQFMFYMIAN
jgi:hypothetical protein